MKPAARNERSRIRRVDRTTAALLSVWLVAAVVTIFAWVSITVMSVLLAYIAGQNQWSRAQKDAVRALERFAHTRAESDYQAFLGHIVVPLADRVGKLELNKPVPDHDKVIDALLNGRVERDDIDGMVWLYRNFRHAPLFREAITYWDRGDQSILQLREIGTRLHAVVRSSSSPELAIPVAIEEIEAVDQQVTLAEEGYSRSLNKASHVTRNVLIFALTSSALLLLTVVTLFVRRSFARGERLEDELRNSEKLAEVTLASIGDAVIRTDEAARVTYCNAIAERMLGRPLAQMKLQPFDAICELRDEGTGTRIAHGAECTRVQCTQAHDGAQPAYYIVRPDGSRVEVDYAATTLRDGDGNAIGMVTVLYDASAERKHAAQLLYQATHDELTDLLNRREFERRLANVLAHGTDGVAGYAVMFLDLDQFKIVNDTCGHAAGDELIRHVGATLRTCLSDQDVLARLGGDEFGVVLPHCAIADALQIANRLCDAIATIRMPWSERTLTTGASIGLVSSCARLASLKEVMKAADVACYMAKENGRNRVHLFSLDDQALSATNTQMEWVARVKAALDEELLCLYAQRIDPVLHGTEADAQRAHDTHIEVLLRMKDASGALVPPAGFVEAAERFNLMPAVDRWVIAHAFAALANGWHAARTWSINLSGASLVDEHLFDYIVAQQRCHGISFDRVCFEITETAAITNLQKATALIGRLRALGCRFALDDFGTGMSSFEYLKHLHVDYLKIDGSFIQDILHSAPDRAIVQSINQVAHATGKRTIAEFADGLAIVECLADIGVDFVQGYGIGVPEPLEPLEASGRQHDALMA
ncbi:EAL domain-containing protein [Paraburkholderia rhizosphaerae]|uniref:Diguanylate cyclase (GGDEF)-like protein n=1 Tax=Paraburkholderia rhizosphaerae TaxID=480658 RepID=A0A4R8M3W6_9BURK|nr:EAL domain-containing protein [Paraburkholderia rhizosphaerae]TDY54711.1 diguanylate cyclase (GGDEF)-like protein [Paraburkholderia rhizosphaerae]